MIHNATWGRGFLWFTLFVSLFGFLGYYSSDGFITPAPAVILSLQIFGGAAGAFFLRARLQTSLQGVIPLLLVSIWSATTLLWADDPLTGLRRWLLVFAPGLLICAIAASDPKPAQTFRWMIAVVVSIVLVSGLFSVIVMAFWQTTIAENALRYFLMDINGWMLGVAEGGRQYELGFYIPRYSGLTSNPNSMSLFAAIGTIALAAMVRPIRGRRDIGLLLIGGLVVFLLLLSGSRASFAMVAAGLFFVIVLRTNHPSIARLSVFLICGLTFTLYFFTFANGSDPQLAAAEALVVSEHAKAGQIASPSHAEVFELRERSQVWRIAMQTIVETWLTGSGFGLVQEVVYAPLGLNTAAHSVTLSTLVETGVIGLILTLVAWIAPVFSKTRPGRPISANDIAIVALLVGLFVHQIVDSSVFRYHWAHFIFVYLLGASAGLSRSRASE